MVVVGGTNVPVPEEGVCHMGTTHLQAVHSIGVFIHFVCSW